MSLAYTRTQLKEILQIFIDKFSDESFLALLRGASPDENVINDMITEYQESVFKDFGINPSKGLDDMRMIGMVYGNDNEIMALLGNVAMKEDNAINQALGQQVNQVQFDPEFLSQMKKKMSDNPELASQQMAMFQKLSSDPQALAQFQLSLESLKSSNYEAYTQFQQMLAYMSLFEGNVIDQTTPKSTAPQTEDMEED